MTEALYLRDCYLIEAESYVITAEGKKIELEQTLFYPESGGQPADNGTILHNGIVYNIITVRKEKGTIVHEVDKEGLCHGNKVIMKIDWQRRYRLMRYHTASHILSTIINSETGAEITGNQIYLDHARDDFSLEFFNRDMIKSFEEKTNEIVAKALPISFKFLSRDEAFKIPLIVKLMKGLPESIQNVRVVDIEGFDKQACGGTHLKNTSEVKGIKITKMENKGKINRRIEFVLID